MYIYSKFHIDNDVFVWDDKFEGVFRKRITAIHVTMTLSKDAIMYEMDGDPVELWEEKNIFDSANSAFWSNPEPVEVPPDVPTDPDHDIPNDQPEF